MSSEYGLLGAETLYLHLWKAICVPKWLKDFTLLDQRSAVCKGNSGCECLELSQKCLHDSMRKQMRVLSDRKAKAPAREGGNEPPYLGILRRRLECRTCPVRQPMRESSL